MGEKQRVAGDRRRYRNHPHELHETNGGNFPNIIESPVLASGASS